MVVDQPLLSEKATVVEAYRRRRELFQKSRRLILGNKTSYGFILKPTTI